MRSAQRTGEEEPKENKQKTKKGATAQICGIQSVCSCLVRLMTPRCSSFGTPLMSISAPFYDSSTVTHTKHQPPPRQYTSPTSLITHIISSHSLLILVRWTATTMDTVEPMWCRPEWSIWHGSWQRTRTPFLLCHPQKRKIWTWHPHPPQFIIRRILRSRTLANPFSPRRSQRRTWPLNRSSSSSPSRRANNGGNLLQRTLTLSKVT
jgi:hypothetical protein